MRVAVGALVPRNHGDVGLGLRVVVERDRKLRVDLPVVAKRTAQRGQHTTDGRRVPAPLRLADHPADRPATPGARQAGTPPARSGARIRLASNAWSWTEGPSWRPSAPEPTESTTGGQRPGADTPVTSVAGRA